MSKKIIWVRISYWIAAVADFIIAGLVLIPNRMGVEHYVYPMGLMSAVAFCWGIILIMADKKPLERSWVLIPTAIVVVLLGFAGLHGALTGLLTLAKGITNMTGATIIASIIAYSYINSRSLR